MHTHQKSTIMSDDHIIDISNTHQGNQPIAKTCVERQEKHKN